MNGVKAAQGRDGRDKRHKEDRGADDVHQAANDQQEHIQEEHEGDGGGSSPIIQSTMALGTSFIPMNSLKPKATPTMMIDPINTAVSPRTAGRSRISMSDGSRANHER